MTKPDKDEKDSNQKQQRGQRHLSGGDELLKGFLLVHESCAEIASNIYVENMTWGLRLGKKVRF